MIPVNGLSYTDELNSRTCEVNEYIHHLTCLNISKKVEIAWCTQDRNTHKGTAENLVLLGHVIEVEVLCIIMFTWPSDDALHVLAEVGLGAGAGAALWCRALVGVRLAVN